MPDEPNARRSFDASLERCRSCGQRVTVYTPGPYDGAYNGHAFLIHPPVREGQAPSCTEVTHEVWARFPGWLPVALRHAAAQADCRPSPDHDY